jgi:hypothetical protein
MNRRKAELVAKIHDRRAKLDSTFDELDARITEVSRLPAKLRDDVVKLGRWTAIVVAVTAVALTSVLVARALIGRRGRAHRRA